MKTTLFNRKTSVIVAFVVLLLSVITIVLSLYLANKNIKNIAAKELKLYRETIELENKVELESVYSTLHIVKGMAQRGILQGGNFENLDEVLSSFVSGESKISALSIVRDTNLFYLTRWEDGRAEAYFNANNAKKKKTAKIVDAKAGIDFFGDTVVNYPISEQPAYKNRLPLPYDTVIKQVTQIVPGFSPMLGTCFSVRTMDTINNKEYFISVYRSTKRTYEFINTVDITEGAQIDLFTRDGKYFEYQNEDSSKGQNYNSLNDYLLPWENAKGVPFYSAIKKWDELGKTDSTSFPFVHDNIKYWASIQRLNENPNGIWSSLIVPESDFSFLLRGGFGVAFYLSLFFMIVSAVIFFLVLKRLNADKGNSALNIAELEDLISGGESNFVEFKSTIRLNLHTQKMGKEIELAWLKSVVAFCNTEGGRIIIGVNDDGEILGLDADRFPNDDKTLLHIQNLIKQHVGLEFSQYIHYSLRPIKGKTVLVVNCHRVKTPVFLKVNDKEQFFVRSGPASIELPVSKALKYIEDRRNSKS